ncbi:Imm53 family immunity protein [Kribbella catacumbae]|uniref:Imm53 family immunity protein n=1 Tax=Kribbella catacumbae TaxID=460086 RepID=UPI000A015F28|nr:Imm53 family immunity protein [Kribbella catacumbae]
MTSNALEFMVSWFAMHCDGDWEHHDGIKIATLDNPGWALDVRIDGTELDEFVVDWRKPTKVSNAGSIGVLPAQCLKLGAVPAIYPVRSMRSRIRPGLSARAFG